MTDTILMGDASLSHGSLAQIGFWGPVTSTIDWCETNYTITTYIAEFWNTISNISFILFGIFGVLNAYLQRFELRFAVTFLGVVAIGVGSAMFHGTLQYHFQQCDETPMVWCMLLWLFIMYASDLQKHKGLARLLPLALFLYGAIFSLLHWIFRFVTFFQAHFMTMIFLGFFRLSSHYRRCTDQSARNMVRLYVLTLVVACAFWLMDFHLCSHMQSLFINPQGHAIWHIFMGLNSYIGPAFAQYVRAQELGLDPIVRYKFGIPYVHILKLP